MFYDSVTVISESAKGQIMIEKKYKLLIVDDESDLLDILSARLEMSGYTVFSAANGQQALDIVSNEKIDLVITDVQMPVVTGIQLLENIRQIDSIKPPVIFITGYSSITLEQAYDKGVQAVFYKPFDFKDLLTCIKKFLSSQDERFHPRDERIAVNTKLNFNYSNLKEAQEAHVLNIGKGGFFMSLEVDKLPAIESKIDFCIQFKDGLAEIKGIGQVKWVRKDYEGDMPPGCGVEFIQLDETSNVHASDLISSLKTAKYIPRY